MENSYKAAGVDITAGYEAVRLMRSHVEKTFTGGVLSGIGGFGGAFELDLKGIDEPVLISGTDGVGTKLKIAFLTGKHDTIGRDCVAMCVNDIVCAGARPLFFLDYIAAGKILPEKVAEIVKGIAGGCVDAGCALIGGETAEMPGLYAGDEYDLAGFAVGIADKKNILGAKNIKGGEAVIGIASSGLHSNGFSLVRKILNINGASGKKLALYSDKLKTTFDEELLKPTKIYVKAVLSLLKSFDVRSISHITGGGFYENIPRMLPEGFGAVVDKNSFETLPIFELLRGMGGISEEDMFSTFNMGIGMALALPGEQALAAISALEGMGEKAYVIGKVEEGASGVRLV